LRPGDGFGDDLVHLVQDMQPGLPGLGQGLGHDLPGQADHFDIHLQRGDALTGAGHFEVHVAQGVLISQDVRQDGHFIPFLHKPHGHPGHRRLDGHARVHQGQEAPHTVAMEEEPLLDRISETTRMV
jgi:hypothetical protein